MTVSHVVAAQSWEDHVEAWHHLGRQVDGASWGRAAIAASLRGRYGEGAVGRFAKEVRFAAGHLYNLARTFECFPEISARAENLTFSHHLIAVVCTAGPEHARAAVGLAEREGWSANALRAHLRSRALATENQPIAETRLAPEDRDAGSERCGPLTADDKLFHVSSLIYKFDVVKDYEMDPLVQACTKKSLRELAKQIDAVTAWLSSLRQTIERRVA